MKPTPLRLGRYVLISEVARGAYGRLSTACTRLESGEAQAVLVRRLAKGEPFESDALEQIEHAARLSMSAFGDHIATAIGVEETDDELGIVFDYADGKDLRSLMSLASLKHQRIPAPVALHIAQSALEGLAELRGDFPEELRTGALWPDSVFVATDGHVKLLDAPVAAVIARAPGPRKFRQLISYSAPEDFEDGADRTQSDVFRAGVLLYEMISGKRLFSGGTTNSNVEQVQRAPIPPFEELAAELAPLAEVVLRALDREREARYASIDDLDAALSECGVERASSQEVAAYLTELLGSGIAIQQRAMAIALDRLAVDESAPPAPVPAAFAALAGVSATRTLLGVPEPAVLPARPPSQRPFPPPPPPPPRRARPPLGSTPLILPSIDDFESPIQSEPDPLAAPTLTDVELIEDPDDEQTQAQPIPLPFGAPRATAPGFAEELDSVAPDAAPRRLGLKRKHLVAGAVALAISLLGAGVLALVGLAGSPPEDTAAAGSASSEAPTPAAPPTPVLESPPRAKSVAKNEEPTPPAASAEPEAEEPAADEAAAADAAAGEQASALVSGSKAAAPKLSAKQKREAAVAAYKKKQAAAKKKQKAAIAAAKRAQAERIAKINKAKAAKAAAAKKKQAAAAKKKKKKAKPKAAPKSGTKTASKP